MDPTLAGAVLGDARDPQPVRGVGHELALHVVLEHRLGALGVPPASAVHTLQPVGAHEPFHALVSAAAVMAQRQFSMDTTDPVCAAGVGMAAMIASSRYASSRSRLLGPRVRLVIARRGDLQHPARHRHRKPLRGEFVDQPETLFGSTFSRAKYAEARLRISIPIAWTRVSRRRRTSSARSSRDRPSLLAFFDIGHVHPPPQARLADREILGDLCDRLAP